MAEQPTPLVSREDVHRVLRRDFPAADYGAALIILEEYRSKLDGETGEARVRLAALKLADGDLKELGRHIAAARQDYRDVLAAAEYPAASLRWSAMSSLREEQRQDIYDADWDQYQEWLQRT